jgi:3-isopropylmalate/(R)-2-methylmalate dehydratase large subunit
LGAFSSGVGSTDLAAAMVTGECWFKVPESMKFVYFGKLNKWVGGKDLILHTIGDIGVDGARYQAMEFCGETIENLPMDDRLSMCNMAIEAGGKNGIIAPDKITAQYLRSIKDKAKPGLGKIYASDKDAKYAAIKEYDVRKIAEPVVACPNLPSNTKGVSSLKNVKLDQVVIGSCTNGRISDMRLAAKVIRGKKVAQGVRLIVIPATQKLYLESGVFSTPTCGPCLGGHMGILAEGEVAIATTNRNFVGRMGHPNSGVYLSNPAVAAASAVTGRITHPEEVM